MDAYGLGARLRTRSALILRCLEDFDSSIVSIENRLSGSSEEEQVILREYPKGTLCAPSLNYVIERIKKFLGDDTDRKNWTRRVTVNTYDSDGEIGLDNVRVYFPDGTFEAWGWQTRPNLPHLMTLVFGRGVRGISHYHDDDLYILNHGSTGDPCAYCASFEGFTERFRRTAIYPHSPASLCHATIMECNLCSAAHYKNGYKVDGPIPPGVVAAMQLTMSSDGMFILSDNFTEEE